MVLTPMSLVSSRWRSLPRHQKQRAEEAAGQRIPDVSSDTLPRQHVRLFHQLYVWLHIHIEPSGSNSYEFACFHCLLSVFYTFIRLTRKQRQPLYARFSGLDIDTSMSPRLVTCLRSVLDTLFPLI